MSYRYYGVNDFMSYMVTRLTIIYNDEKCPVFFCLYSYQVFHLCMVVFSQNLGCIKETNYDSYSPHNPTGKVFSKEELEVIAAACCQMDCLAITDEVCINLFMYFPLKLYKLLKL